MPSLSHQQRSSSLPLWAATDTNFNAGTAPSVDILTEDIDQAVLHFSAAVKEQNQPVITRTVLFMNEVLASTAWRARHYHEEEESVCSIQAVTSTRVHSSASAPPPAAAGLERNRNGVPSLMQWVDTLESLTAAALPTALKYLRDLYQLSTAWTQTDRRCSLAVLNLVFFTLVLCRQTQRRVAALRLRQQRQTHQWQQRASAMASLNSTITPFLFEASHTAPPAAPQAPPSLTANGRELDVLEARVKSLYQAQQTIVVRYLCFIAWNAESQLHAVKVNASVCIKGMPLLHELPRVPLYLSEYDGWIWVWMTATLYSTLNLQKKHDAHPAPHHSMRASVGTTSVGSPPPAATPRCSGMNVHTVQVDSGLTSSGRLDSTLFPGADAPAAAAVNTAPGSPNSSRQRGFSHGQTFGGGGGGGATSSVDDMTGNNNNNINTSGVAQPVRSEVVRVLLQMSKHEGGELYMHKIVSVIFSSFEFFLDHWTGGQPVVGDLFREWTQRIVHSRLSPEVASINRLHALFSLILNGSLQELTRIVITLDDIVVHTAFLFFSSTRPLLRLHRLLEQLVPLQVTLLLMYQLHPEAHRNTAGELDDDEIVGDYRLPEDSDEAQSSGMRSRRTPQRRGRTHEVCAEAILGYCTAVSQLLAHVAELLLEPWTQRTYGFNAFQLPQSMCSTMLKSTMMFMASEIMLNEDYWLSVRGVGSGRDGSRVGSPAMRKQWRWWAVWSNTSHFVCVTGGRFGELEESDTDHLHHQRRRDVLYVQAISLALEDMYALLQMIVSTDTQRSQVAARTLSLIFSRLRMFFVRLHEEHLAAINLHVVSPFSALCDYAFNAFAQLLEHYVAVTATDCAPFLVVPPPSSGGNLLRSTMQSNVLPTTSNYSTPPQLQHQLSSSSFNTPPHRSLWLLSIAYLRLATVEASSSLNGDPTPPLDVNSERRPGESAITATTLTRTKDTRKANARRHLISTPNFVCATTFASLFYLRDRSYESSEDWMQQPNKWKKNILSRSGTEVPQLHNSAHLFRCYRGEVQQTEDAARELLLLASVRLLSAAVHAASRTQSTEEAERLSRSTSSFTNLHGDSPSAESQASVYVSAFSRYLCMLKDISSPCLLFLLQSIRDELRCCKEREDSTRQSNASALAGEGNNWLGEQDMLDARAFEWEVSLYSV